MRFFHVNFLNARGILIHFLTLKMGDDPNNQVSLVSWLPGNPNALELAVVTKGS